MKQIPPQLHDILKQRYLNEAMSLSSPTSYTSSAKKDEEKKKPTRPTEPPFVSYDRRIDLSKVLPDFSPPPPQPGPGTPGYVTPGFKNALQRMGSDVNQYFGQLRSEPNFFARASRATSDLGSKVGKVLSHPRVQLPTSLGAHMALGYYPAKWTSETLAPYLPAPEYIARYPGLVVGEVAAATAIGAAKQGLKPETWTRLRRRVSTLPLSPSSYIKGTQAAGKEMLFKGGAKGAVHGLKNLKNPYVWLATAAAPELFNYFASGRENLEADSDFESELEKIEGTEEYDKRIERERAKQEREFDRMSPQQRRDYEEALKGQKTKRTALGDFVTQGIDRDVYPEVDYKLENLLTDVGKFALDPITPTMTAYTDFLARKAEEERKTSAQMTPEQKEKRRKEAEENYNKSLKSGSF